MKILSAIFGAILFPIGVFFGVLFLMYIGYEIWQKLSSIYEWIMEKLSSENVLWAFVLIVILTLAFIGGKFGYMWAFGTS